MFRCFFILVTLFFTNIGFVHAEVISDFSVDYVVRSDAVVEVTETITYDFEGQNRRGIFRTLEKKHPQPSTEWYKNWYVDVEVLSVNKGGLSEKFVISDSNKDLEIKIGDPNKTITGPHEYEITYLLTGAISYGDAGAEFYWNVTGNDWPVAIGNVKATVRSAVDNIITGSNACYEGRHGSTDPCGNIEKFSNQVTFTASNLRSGEGLTIATELNPDVIAFLTTEKVSYLPLGFIFATLLLLFFGYKVYRFRAEFKIDLPVIAQYEPYKDYLPMYTGVLYDGRLDPKDITAGIIYLAEQGFIKIKKTEKKVLLFITTTDYEITLLRPVTEIPTDFLQRLMGLMFDSFDSPQKTVMLSSLIKNRVRNAKLIRLLQSDLKKDLIENDFTIKKWPKFGWYLIALPTIPFIFFSVTGSIEKAIILDFFIFIPFMVMIILLLVAKRTKKGYEVLNHLEGFKLFLSVTDKERFEFHNAPSKNPEMFMKYLPYAIALGVEKEWAKVFEDIAIPKPDWYDGGNINTFSATALTSDIGAFSSSFTASSGTSGSSGGGSSGGGGGGGGGGSW